MSVASSVDDDGRQQFFFISEATLFKSISLYVRLTVHLSSVCMSMCPSLLMMMVGNSFLAGLGSRASAATKP